MHAHFEAYASLPTFQPCFRPRTQFFRREKHTLKASCSWRFGCLCLLAVAVLYAGSQINDLPPLLIDEQLTVQAGPVSQARA